MSTISELLIQIAENTKPDNKAIWVAAISSTSAIFGAGIGAFLLYRGTSKQITAQKETEERKLKVGLITAERLRWLQDIRTRSSDLYVNLDMHYNLLKRPINHQKDPSYQKQGDELARVVMLQSNQITFLLNPAKATQKKSIDAINNAMTFISECSCMRNINDLNFDDAKYASIKSAFFEAITEIGSETWKKIKSLE